MVIRKTQKITINQVRPVNGWKSSLRTVPCMRGFLNMKQVLKDNKDSQFSITESI